MENEEVGLRCFDLILTKFYPCNYVLEKSENLAKWPHLLG